MQQRALHRRQVAKGPGNQPRKAGNQYLGSPGLGRRDVDQKACCRDDPFIGAKDSRAQSADAVDHVDFGMARTAHAGMPCDTACGDFVAQIP